MFNIILIKTPKKFLIEFPFMIVTKEFVKSLINFRLLIFFEFETHYSFKSN